MDIVIKKKEDKIDILNNLKIVKNVIDNTIVDLEKMLLKSGFSFNNNHIVSSYFDSMHSTLFFLNTTTKLVEYSIENNLEININEQDMKYLINVDDYCNDINEKTNLAKEAIKRYYEVVTEPKKRGFIRTFLGI